MGGPCSSQGPNLSPTRGVVPAHTGVLASDPHKGVVPAHTQVLASDPPQEGGPCSPWSPGL